MRELTPLMTPLLVSAVCVAAFLRGTPLYEALVAGARKGLTTALQILPALLVLFPVIWLFRASGLPELLGRVLGPALKVLGIPEESVLLMLLRPLSGAGALAAAGEIIAAAGPDSLVGRTAAVMIGASETSFYVVAVYFSAAGVKESRWAIPAALCADLVCYVSAAWLCRLLWG